MDKLVLDGQWKVLEQPLSRQGIVGLKKVKATRAGWMRADIPGEIHLDLMRAGRMPEPLISTNAPRCRWPEKKSWWYRTTFDAPEGFLAHERQELVFDGIDLYGQVFVNGALVGEAKNAFVPAAFDVRCRLKAKCNELVVRVTCGTELAPADQQAKPISREVYGNRNQFPGRVHLRKPQFSYGWDWVDALPNIGIWRSVRLEGATGVVLHDARLDTVIKGRSVSLDAVVTLDNLHPWSERPCAVQIRIKPPHGKAIVQTIPSSVLPGLSRVTRRIPIPDPRLWWPNGMGEQPLYGVTVRVTEGRRELDRREWRAGLRTVAIDRRAIRAGGSRFRICVNGKAVFCKGGNWVPADAIIARAAPEKLRHLVREAANANCNMLRVWGGGIYEAPAFYDACDEAGILVWQDFLFACAQYPDRDPHFRAAIRAEAESAVKGLRQHPCIALWSGNNENTWAFAEWWNWERINAGEDPEIGGALLYNRVLPEVCAQLDPARPYWTGSPAGGVSPNCETDGDCHWWGRATMHKDIDRRIRDEVYDECRARFVSEYGVIGPCSMASAREFLKADEVQVNSRAWREHTNTFEKATTPAAIRYHYADPEGLDVETYILYGQMFQARMYGRTIEALRFRKHDPTDDCAGALIWMYNDCWGEHGWTPIDYYLRRKPSYYWIRAACQPVKAIVRRRGDALVTRLVNDTLAPVAVDVSYGWMRVDGAERRLRQKTVNVPANGMRQVASEPIPAASDVDPSAWIYVAIPAGGCGDVTPATWQAAPYRQFNLPAPVIDVRRRGNSVALSCATYVHGVHIDDEGEGLLSDNYFDLLPGVPKVVRVAKTAERRALTFRGV